MNDEAYLKMRDRYGAALEKLFFPPDPAKYDIINYFSSLLRVTGMEDNGWDPYAESKGLLFDINSIFKMDLPIERFPEPALTSWRMGLFMYSHILEMDAPYEVITNLMRYQLGHGYSPNPYDKFLNAEGRKKQKRSGLFPLDKIGVIKKLDKELKCGIGEVFDEFYNPDLRNAISHSDFVLTESHFRVRNNRSTGPFSLDLDTLDQILTNAKAFIGAFFELEHCARRHWGKEKDRGIPYDPVYKGLMEVLTDNQGLLCGFKVHWPNNSESFYKRSDEGISMVNCYASPDKGTVDLFVNLYASKPGKFSPLVEKDSEPQYTKLENGTLPTWSDNELES